MRALCSTLLVVLTTSALLLGSSVAEAMCPVRDQAYSWNQEQYGSGFSNHSSTWYMSPCSLGTPKTHNTPVYLALSSNADASRFEFPKIAFGWHKYRHEFYIEFTSTNGISWAKVHVTCDDSVASGTVIPNGAIHQTKLSGDWVIPIKMLCKQHAPPPPFCPGNSGQYSWTQQQYGGSGNETDSWFMSPCALAIAPSSGDDEVYLNLPSISGQIGLHYSVVDVNWHQLSGSNPLQYRAKFSDPAPNVWVNVTVTCNASVSMGVVVPNGKARSVNPGSVNYYLPLLMNCGGTGTFAPGVTTAPPMTTAVPGSTPAPTDPCAQWQGCYACVNGAPNTCGWCSTTGSCSTGQESGPSQGQCGGTWYWATDSCPTTPSPVTTTVAPMANCGQYSTCDACTNSNSGTCGFCTGTKTCESGTSNGPNSGKCAAGHWNWVSSQCRN